MEQAPSQGDRVRVARLESTDGMTINPRHLDVREVGVVGKVKSYVPGHGGDVWFVQHEGSDQIGAYCYTELEPAPEAVLDATVQ